MAQVLARLSRLWNRAAAMSAAPAMVTAGSFKPGGTGEDKGQSSMVDIVVPTLGESVTEATVAKWLKKPGDAVKKDETLVELETDKVAVEVSAPDNGVLGDIVAQEGATVEIGALLGRMTVGAGAAATAPPAPKPPQTTAAPPPPPQPAARPAPQPAPTPQRLPPAGQPAPPSVQRIAAEGGVSPASIPGTGRDGRVTKADALTYLERAGQPPAPARGGGRALGSHEERVKMTRLRQTIARRLKEAQNTAAMLTTFNEADMTAVMDIRARHKEAFERRHGVKLGFMSFFVKACVAALKEIPAVNGEIDGDDIIYKNYYDIGIAVGTDRGLVVPVLRDAEHKSPAEIERDIADLGARARDGSLKLEDLQGATFTITNGGVYGSLMSTPILNAPQSGILGMHKIQERPVAINGRVLIRPMMYLALSYDHRLVDGREAVTFLVRVKEYLEDIERHLLDV